MKSDQEKWDKRYSGKQYPENPSDIIKEFVSLADKGRALDLAAGNGRNSCFLAECGFEVDAVDISEVGLSQLTRQDARINPIHHDLDFYVIERNRYELVVNINFLQRRLFPYIKNGLKKGGLLIFQTFLEEFRVDKGFDYAKQDQFLMRNELLYSFLSFDVIYYREDPVTFSNGVELESATLVARKP